jgi:hypothetical protein
MSKSDITIGNAASLRSLKSALKSGPKQSKDLFDLLQHQAIDVNGFLEQGQKVYSDVLQNKAVVARLLLDVNGMIENLEKSESGEAAKTENSDAANAQDDQAEKSTESSKVVDELRVLADHLNTIATADISKSVAVDNKQMLPTNKEVQAAKKAYEAAKQKSDQFSKPAENEAPEAKAEREASLEEGNRKLTEAENAYAEVSNDAKIRFIKERADVEIKDLKDLNGDDIESKTKEIESKRDADIKEAKGRFNPVAAVSSNYKAALESVEKLLKMKEVTSENGFKAFFQRVAESIIRAYRSVVRFFTVKDIYSEAANAETDIEKVAIFEGMNLADQNKAFTSGVDIADILKNALESDSPALSFSALGNMFETVNVADGIAKTGARLDSSKLGRQAARVAGKVADVVKTPFVALKGAYNFCTGPLSTYTQPVASDTIKQLPNPVAAAVNFMIFNSEHQNEAVITNGS